MRTGLFIPRRTVLLLLLLMTGCQPTATQSPGPSAGLPEELTDVAMARLARIRQEDPLAVGRVTTVFDFEQPVQVEAFQKFGEDSYDVRHMSTARAATGLSSLQVRLTPQRPSLAAERGVPADWRESRLLRFEVYAEADVPGFTVTVADRDGRAAERGPYRLRPGWQAITIEIERLASLVNIERIERLAFAVRGLAEPVTFWLDDVVLIDNRTTRWPVYGNQRTVGYRVAGRTLTVFGPAGFEISFAPDDEGTYRLTEWISLLDRRRIPQSAPRAALLTIDPQIEAAETPPAPPAPPPATEPASQPASQSATQPTSRPAEWTLGRYRLDACRVIELNRVRVRVRLERLFFDASRRIAETYTIYGSGQVYGVLEVDMGEGAAVRSTQIELRTSEVLRPVAAASTLSLEGRGRGEGVDAGPQVIWTAHADPRRGREAAALLVLAAGSGEGTWQQSRWPGRLSLSQLRLTPPDAPGGPGGAVGSMRVAFLLNLNPGPADGLAAAVADYVRPMDLRFTRGRLAYTDPGDANQDGFNEAEGCHVLRADDEVVRLLLRPDATARQSPAFKIANLKTESFLVNVGGRVTEVIARDAAGAALAQIPGRLTRPVDIEITPATGTRHPVLPEIW